MCIIPDSEIAEAASRGLLISSNYSSAGLTPNGYDLRVDEIMFEGSAPSRTISIPPTRWFAVSTLEWISLPDDICAQLWIRSSFARRGVISSFGKVDAGFHGRLTLSGYNAASTPLSLTSGTRFAQIVFERLCSPAGSTYDKRTGHYQGSDGIVLSRDAKDEV